MSSELKLKLVYDSSDAERAAKDLPDAVDRQNRRARRSYEGRGAGDIGPGDYRRMAGAGAEIEKQIKAEEEAKIKAAEEAAQAAQAAKEKEDKETEAWHRKELSRKLKEAEEAEKAAERAAAAERKAAEQAQAEADRKSRREEAARAKADKETEEWHRKELRRKLKDLEAQKKAEEKAAKDKAKAAEQASGAKDWEAIFVGRIGSGLVNSLVIGVLVGALKFAITGLKDSIVQAVGRGQVGGASSAAYGTQAKDIFQTYLLLRELSDMKEEEVINMTEKVASMGQDIATGVSGKGAAAFKFFGIDPMKYKDQPFEMRELLANMSDKYKQSGETAQFQYMMKEFFGDDWKKLRPALAAGRRVIEAGTTVTLEAGPAEHFTTAGLNAVNIRRRQLGLPPLSDLKGGGGVPGAGMPSMPFATSLQQMGGGDVLSAINRGPMDTLVKASEETAENTRIMSTKDAKTSGHHTVTIGAVRSK